MAANIVGAGGQFDIDLLRGQVRERAFARILCQATFEHKDDRACRSTSNLFVEVSQGIPSRPSGIRATAADWWVTEFADDCRIILPTHLLKDALEERSISNGSPVSGGDNSNYGYLVNLHWLIDFCRRYNG